MHPPHTHTYAHSHSLPMDCFIQKRPGSIAAILSRKQDLEEDGKWGVLPLPKAEGPKAPGVHAPGLLTLDGRLPSGGEGSCPVSKMGEGCFLHCEELARGGSWGWGCVREGNSALGGEASGVRAPSALGGLPTALPVVVVLVLFLIGVPVSCKTGGRRFITLTQLTPAVVLFC